MSGRNGPSPDRVTIVEVAPRDGLQNDPRDFSVVAKIAFIEALAEAGMRVIETTSFVRPDLVPKMADAFEVVSTIEMKPGVRYLSLVPNVRGLDRCLEAGGDAIALFLAASEAFSQANTRCSIAESIGRIRAVTDRARARNLYIRGYISVAFHCPFSGAVDPDATLALVTTLNQIGCDEIVLADTIGTATPEEVASLVRRSSGLVDLERLAVHLHDTSGRAIECVNAAFLEGVRIFDAAAGGLGGCPFAPGAPGNVATEDVLAFFDSREIETGIDSAMLSEALAALMATSTDPGQTV